MFSQLSICQFYIHLSLHKLCHKLRHKLHKLRHSVLHKLRQSRFISFTFILFSSFLIVFSRLLRRIVLSYVYFNRKRRVSNLQKFKTENTGCVHIDNIPLPISAFLSFQHTLKSTAIKLRIIFIILSKYLNSLLLILFPIPNLIVSSFEKLALP